MRGIDGASAAWSRTDCHAGYSLRGTNAGHFKYTVVVIGRKLFGKLPYRRTGTDGSRGKRFRSATGVFGKSLEHRILPRFARGSYLGGKQFRGLFSKGKASR